MEPDEVTKCRIFLDKFIARGIPDPCARAKFACFQAREISRKTLHCLQSEGENVSGRA